MGWVGGWVGGLLLAVKPFGGCPSTVLIVEQDSLPRIRTCVVTVMPLVATRGRARADAVVLHEQSRCATPLLFCKLQHDSFPKTTHFLECSLPQRITIGYLLPSKMRVLPSIG